MTMTMALLQVELWKVMNEIYGRRYIGYRGKI
jgi:hypothetical protein